MSSRKIEAYAYSVVTGSYPTPECNYISSAISCPQLAGFTYRVCTAMPDRIVVAHTYLDGYGRLGFFKWHPPSVSLDFRRNLDLGRSLEDAIGLGKEVRTFFEDIRRSLRSASWIEQGDGGGYDTGEEFFTVHLNGFHRRWKICECPDMEPVGPVCALARAFDRRTDALLDDSTDASQGPAK
jgi:hypothetical protein